MMTNLHAMVADLAHEEIRDWHPCDLCGPVDVSSCVWIAIAHVDPDDVLTDEECEDLHAQVMRMM